MSEIFNTYVILKMTNYKYAKTDIFIALQTYMGQTIVHVYGIRWLIIFMAQV